ncbi:MAG TPA: hypothetical protein DCZ12_09645 [Gammaproteobacteria bacterium]|nr:hypothetical protein [Gammaproteobacteria bacterium]
MNVPHKVTRLCAAISTALLISCNAEDPDTSTGDSATITGIAIDGYIAYGTVYVDADSDNRLSVTDPRALTDQDGYFSYNPSTGQNYCADNATALEKRYCLRTYRHMENVILRIVGGYDTQTGEAFDGSMSTRIASTSESVGHTAITPLSSVLAGVSQDDQSAILVALGLTESDLNINYLSSTDYNSQAFTKALQLHKSVVLLNELFKDHYEDSDTSPADLSPYIYTEIAKQLLSSQHFTVSETLLSNIDKVIRESLKNDDKLPAALDTASQGIQQMITRTHQIQTMITQLVDGTNKTAGVAAARAVEVAVQKILNKEPDASINSAIPDNITAGTLPQSELASYLAKLSDETVDLQVLVESSAPEVDVEYAAPDTSEASQLNTLNSYRVAFDYAEDTAAGEIVFLFDGETHSPEGDVYGCLKYSDTADTQYDTQGTLMTGHWSAMPGNDYAVLLDVKLGSEAIQQQLVMKSIGIDGGTSSHQFRFEFAGKYGVWESEDGVTPVADSNEMPQDSTACAAYFDHQ